jgi:hypothetical protein
LDGSAVLPHTLASAVEKVKSDLPVWLLPPPEAVLKRIVSVPLSAFANFAKLLPLEIERLTPYRCEEIASGWKEASRTAKLVEVELRYIPRKLLLKLSNPLERTGLVPSKIALGPEPEFRVAASDFVSASRLKRIRSRRFATATLGIAVVIFVAVDWWTALKTRTAWQQQVAREIRQLAQQKTLEKRIADLTGSIESSRSQSLARSQSLLALARALPATDWLTEVTFRDRAATLRGYAANPELLLKQLEPLAMDKQVSLQGEMTLDAKLARQRFVVTLQLREADHRTKRSPL